MAATTYFSVVVGDPPAVKARHNPAYTSAGITVTESVTLTIYADDATVAIQGDPDLVRHTLADALAAVTETIAEARA